MWSVLLTSSRGTSASCYWTWASLFTLYINADPLSSTQNSRKRIRLSSTLLRYEILWIWFIEIIIFYELHMWGRFWNARGKCHKSIKMVIKFICTPSVYSSNITSNKILTTVLILAYSLKSLYTRLLPIYYLMTCIVVERTWKNFNSVGLAHL